MTQPPDTDQEGRFTGDRYERLAQAAEIAADDPGIYDSDNLIDGTFIRTFVREIAEAKLLDGMSERDCDTFGLLLVLDTRMGPPRIAWRINRWLEGDQLDRDTAEDNPLAVCSALTAALKMLIDAFLEALSDEAAEHD